jgi:TolA-binding protein
MTSASLRIGLSALGLVAIAAAPALAQRPLTTEQRIAVLEQQVAASQTAAIRLGQRLDSIERQLQQLINQGEVNGHSAAQLQGEISKLRSDMESRLATIETRPAPQQLSDVSPEEVSLPARPEKVAESKSSDEQESSESQETAKAAPSDPGEDAYSEGYHLWRDGRYSQAITALRAFVSGFPKHRRVSFANNLIGRALLDDGKPRAAAEALLANYRSDPKGERAPDSLYYLGQALVQLNQAGQACKAYAELEDVYGTSVRPDLKSLVDKAKAQANCS